ELQVILVGGYRREHRVARLVELQAIQTDREPVLSELLVAGVISGLSGDYPVQREGCFCPLLLVEEALGCSGRLRHLPGDHRRLLGRLASARLTLARWRLPTRGTFVPFLVEVDDLALGLRRGRTQHRRIDEHR